MRAYTYFSIIVPQLQKTADRSSETVLPTYHNLLPEKERYMTVPRGVNTQGSSFELIKF